MSVFYRINRSLGAYILSLVLLVVFALWIKSIAIETPWHKTGLMNFTLGFVMLAAFISANIMKILKLPMISGYILTGILAGPYLCGFLSFDMVARLKLIDDLALSFIALCAGGALHLPSLKSRGLAIGMNVVFQTIAAFLMVSVFMLKWGQMFLFSKNIPSAHLTVIAVFLGVIAVARSPSSTLAVISETRAKGPFTDTALGVTVVIDVLIIVLFTLSMTFSRIYLRSATVFYPGVFLSLVAELAGAILAGAILGKAIAWYIDRAGYDLSLFLLLIAFTVTRLSGMAVHFMDIYLGYSLHLEPLLICMAAGFSIRNFSQTGPKFVESLESSALPIFVLFFTIAGAALNLDALRICWPAALALTVVRVAGIAAATWLASIIGQEPPRFFYTAWMAYITQAGVAIGLARLAQRQFPEIGVYLTTLVLAVITINQVIGPILFKTALGLVGETGKR